jgi:uncharacterized protein YndB with AHSA1/START domain
MAAAIALSTPVNASPETIFAALTESAGLAAFWTGDSQAEPVVGSVAHLGFPSGSRLELRVEALQAGRRVVWTPLNDVVTGPHWVGTSVTWDLRRTDSGSTEVLLQQDHWPAAVTQTELAGRTYVWAQVLRTLKGYAETGTPQPYFLGAGRQLARPATEAPTEAATAPAAVASMWRETPTSH